MKALLDENLSFRLVDVLRQRFPGSMHDRDLGLTGDDDERIWTIAKDDGVVIFSKDNDFLARALVRGHPPQVVQICMGNASTRRPRRCRHRGREAQHDREGRAGFAPADVAAGVHLAPCRDIVANPAFTDGDELEYNFPKSTYVYLQAKEVGGVYSASFAPPGVRF